MFKILVLPLLYFISSLPFWLLYRLSDFFFIIVYLLIGYRKKVVTINLQKSFPEKTPQQIAKIRLQFYRHFCDVIFETLKLLTISKSTFIKRCVMDAEARENFEYFIRKNQSIIGIMGHCGNWEWGAISHQIYFSRLLTGVYHPLSNKNFDKLMLDMRSRFGGDIVAMNNLLKRLITLRQQNTSTTVGLIADQTPPPESAYWTMFLNQDTPVFNGPEKLAKKFNYPVVYLAIKKIKRGYYRLETTILTETPQLLADGELSEMHTKLLEANIKEQPFSWLWSHRRWKHKKPA